MTARNSAPLQLNSRRRVSPARLARLLCALAPAVLASRGLAENQPLPDFRAPDLNGVPRTLADYSGKATLVLFWTPANARSRSALCAAASLAAGYPQCNLVTLVSGDVGRNDISQALQACKDRPPVLLDSDRRAFGDYQVISLPTLLVAGADRKLKAKLAGFGVEGLGQAQTALDALYGRQKTAGAATPDAAPEALQRYSMARRFAGLGLSDQAVSTLRSVTTGFPAFRPAWLDLAYLHIAAGRSDEAAACLSKAVELDKAANDAAAGMAWLAWKRGDLEQARSWASRVPAADPNAKLIGDIR
ncbi:MAG: tetratricopeptide repeat protein [Acidobacteria bacterium]|nr:tetratricopeptide repeat protein [Acidobacteriota bacterium]